MFRALSFFDKRLWELCVAAGGSVSMVVILCHLLLPASAYGFCNGSGQRIRIVEKDGATVLSEQRYLWYPGDVQPSQERDASNAITKRYFGQGVQVGGTSYFYTRDHLGSVRELCDTTGAVRARFSYDPWGRRGKVEGDLDADMAFTGHFHHPPSQLSLTLFRAYDPELGRWISKDPIEENGGLNFYGYVSNNPQNLIDHAGLWQVNIFGTAGLGGYLTFGYNGGQWNFGVRVGAGGGIIAGLDLKNTGCRKKGLGAAAGVDVAVGAGVVGGAAGISTDSKQEDTVYCGGRVGPIAATVTHTHSGTIDGGTWYAPTVSGGAANAGAAAFVGGGISYAGNSCKCP